MAAEFRKTSLSLRVNKSRGGGCFCVPCSFTARAPEGTAGLFNVDSRPVCPDVALPDSESPYLTPNSTHMPVVDVAALKMNNKAVNCIELCVFLYPSHTGIQEGTQCTKCKNEWALKTSIALLYVLCTLLTIAVAVLGYKGETIPLVGSSLKHSYVSDACELQGHRNICSLTHVFSSAARRQHTIYIDKPGADKQTKK